MHSILIDNKVVAKTPRHLGVNVEIQDHHDQCNLWDWLADSGATLLREFHPEKNLRRQAATAADYAHVDSPESFARFRAALAADPDRNVPWDNYLFAERVPWLGVPDGIVGKLKEAGLDAVISMGYGPMSFPRPLVTEWTVDGIPRDDQIDWGAAACAYEFYFAMLHRYASRFGITHFMLRNEPEYDSKPFHFPSGFQGQELFWFKELIQREREALRLKEQILATQLGVMARLARTALEDVRGLLANRDVAARLFLTGPASHASWEAFWRFSHPYLDALDYHHYDQSPEAFRRSYARVAMCARQHGKKTAVSEFNLKPGELKPQEMFFNLGKALDMAALLMAVLASTRPDDPGCEFATVYQFHFPATHRNYKSLVYGDMNKVNWTGCDQVDGEAYPSFEELQLRFPTPAYHLFRMLARCVPGGRGAAAYDVLDCGSSILNNVDPQGWHQLQTLAIEQEDQLVVSLLNPSQEAVADLTLDFEPLQRPYAFAVVRETSLVHRDAAVAQHRLTSEAMTLELPPESLTQVILTPLRLDKIANLRLEERSVTPGTAQNLATLQTTRLRAIGLLDGETVDLTNLNVVWESSRPNAVIAHQGGLIQRLKHTPGDTVILAKTLDGVTAPGLTIPSASPSQCSS